MKKRFWIPAAIFLILIITYFAGPLPPEPTYNLEWPQVPDDPDQLATYIQQKEDTMPVRKDNQARIIWHNDLKAVTEYSFVYLHGFTGSYRDAYPVNVNVADTFGANIYLARWAGHGLEPSAAMENFTAKNAWQSAKEALAIGHQIGEKVIIMCTSTGGTLGLMLAANYPDSVHALINISPNIKDDQIGATLLDMPWGYEIAHLVALGQYREIAYEKEIARQYWDTRYPAEALIQLQVLVESTMNSTTFRQITCPVLTLYYHENFLEEDEHVEVSLYPKVHELFVTPDSLNSLVSLKNPGTHFIGSAIMSEEYLTAQQRIIDFCQEKLNMKVDQ